MSERTGGQRQVRRPAYFLLAVAAAIASPEPDALSMLMLLLPAVVLIEVGYFVYRRNG